MTTPTMFRTRTRTPEEVDRAKAPEVEATVMAVTIAETTQVLYMHLKENKRQSNFQINNYQNRVSTHSIQEDC